LISCIDKRLAHGWGKAFRDLKSVILLWGPSLT
jgi:hypothetical protein